MLTPILSWGAVSLLFVASLAILLTRHWRRSLAFLAAQYFGVFLLTQIHWTLSMAAVKLVTGWMVATILGITRTALEPEFASAPDRSLPESRLFRILAAILLLLVVFAATTSMVELLPGIGVPEVVGSLILMTMGLLHLGLTIQPLRVVIGLLTVLAGFEIIYAVVETSTLVAALLSVVNLGLALVGAYLITAGSEDLEATQ